jgi:hypothetical protein
VIGYDLSINSVVVAFRGTINLLNTIVDAMVLPTSYPMRRTCNGCEVHGGFKMAYAALLSASFRSDLVT